MTPIRSCSLCRSKKEKINLYRIVGINNIAILDEKQNINTRGMYVCKDKKCIENYVKMINKSKHNLKIKVEKESVKKLLELLLIRMGE